MDDNNTDFVTADYVRSRLDYDPTTGIVTWKTQTPLIGGSGSIVSSKDSKGYGRILISGKYMRLHRIAWLHFYGELPNVHLDHINGIRDDNRISNLRLATREQNGRNIKKHKDSASPFKGVTFHKGVRKWQSQICIGKGKYKYLGIYAEPEDAARAYDMAAISLYGEYAKTNSMLGLIK